jgi:2-C-methyl-D-erythritol 2,4-cyclodiphosphate synthase
MDFRIGFGYDMHVLKEGRPLRLGGVTIPHHKGPLGHSDGDVLIHALCDALLGACCLGDIGSHFPDTDGKYKDLDSTLLLKEVMAMVKREGYSVGNVDSTVLLETPRIMPYAGEMKKVLSGLLDLPATAVSIKATTNEKLGPVGREEGVSAYAVVLIRR